MAKVKFSIFLCMLVAAMGFGSPSPRAADNDDACGGSPFDAVMRLPSPLRKWGQIICTPFGHVLGSRDGWIWASLEKGSRVLIPSQIAGRNPQQIGNESYFTAIGVSELQPDELASAVAMFNDGLHFDEPSAKGYRADLVSVSGAIITMYFFDFGTFGGGMACPDGDCALDSRFLIMERQTKPRPPSV